MEVEPSHTGFPLAFCRRGVTVTRRFWCHDLAMSGAGEMATCWSILSAPRRGRLTRGFRRTEEDGNDEMTDYQLALMRAQMVKRGTVEIQRRVGYGAPARTN